MNIKYLSSEFMKQIAHEIPQTMSVGHLVKIRHSLIILKAESNFKDVYFWGRIEGVEADYHIAYGYRSDCLNEQFYFYSIDCIEWIRLETWNDEILKVNPFEWNRFQGDSSFIHSIETV